MKHLHYEEPTGQVQYRDPRGPWKTWEHAVHFLADFVQHIPRARQHQVTYAGYFANALGNLKDPSAEPKCQPQAKAKNSRYIPILRSPKDEGAWVRAGPRWCCATGQQIPSFAAVRKKDGALKNFI